MNETESQLRERVALDPPEALGPGELSAIFAAVAADTVDRPRRGRARLAELSTPMRVALAVGGALAMAGVALGIVGLRADLSGAAAARYALAMAGVAGLIGAVFAVSLRGAHQRPLGGRVWALVGLALAVPIVLALAPGVWETTASMAGAEHAMHPFGSCGVMGLVTGLVTAAVAWVFQRERLRAAWRLVAAAAGGGLTAFAILQLHCPSTDVTHLVVAHAGVGILLAGAALVVVLARGRRS